MCKVIIFGTGRAGNTVNNSLKNEVDVIAFADNDKTKWGRVHNGKKIIPPDEINRYNFDFILIGSQYNEEIYNQLLKLQINKSKIFQFYKFIDFGWNYVNWCLNNAINNRENIEALITGISYAYFGFSKNSCVKEMVSLANSSQDLYYDYHLIEYLLYKYKFSKLKTVIIGISYYSFQYDMSLSAMRNKVPLYYETIGLKHNAKDINKLLEGKNETRVIGNAIFNVNEHGNAIIKWDIPKINNEETILRNSAKKQAYIDCNKDYPETVKENVEIFKNYLVYLKKHDINPVVVVFPAHNDYTKHFSSRIEKEFLNIISETKKSIGFQYIDYFRSCEFSEDEYFDYTHLNSKGAEKFTKILNEVIEW